MYPHKKTIKGLRGKRVQQLDKNYSEGQKKRRVKKGNPELSDPQSMQAQTRSAPSTALAN